MKFLILKTKDRKPGQPQFRVFLADGTELTGAIRIAVNGNPAQRTVTRHSIDQPSPDKLHFEVDSVEMEFADAEVQMIDEVPEDCRINLRTMNLYFARWTTHGGFGLTATIAANTEAEALDELALIDSEKLELIEAVGSVRGDRYTQPTIISREFL